MLQKTTSVKTTELNALLDSALLRSSALKLWECDAGTHRAKKFRNAGTQERILLCQTRGKIRRKL